MNDLNLLLTVISQRIISDHQEEQENHFLELKRIYVTEQSTLRPVSL